MQFWDDEEEEWMYKNAVKGVLPGTQVPSLYHTDCFDGVASSGKGFDATLLAPVTPRTPPADAQGEGGGGPATKRAKLE